MCSTPSSAVHGSGQKYKRCCRETDEAAKRAEREASNEVLRADGEAAITSVLDRHPECAQATNAVLRLIQSREFAQAEAAARAQQTEADPLQRILAMFNASPGNLPPGFKPYDRPMPPDVPQTTTPVVAR